MKPHIAYFVFTTILCLYGSPAASESKKGREITFVEINGSTSSKGADAVALFAEDAWTPNTACRDNRLQSTSGVRCQYKVTGEVRIGTEVFWTGVTVKHHEFEGMYSLIEEVVLARPTKNGRLGRVHIITQFDEEVVDESSSIKMRRYWTGDIDGTTEGAHELCIESISETGPGLFEVMELNTKHWRWFPKSRSRGVTAWAVQQDRIVRRAFLDEQCPKHGYRLFIVSPASYKDPLYWRRQAQGKDLANIKIGKRRAKWLTQ